jgi:4-deoxy-L-threo-5-hexosulose-uronate ketol-isomerase
MMRLHHVPGPVETPTLSPADLRTRFLIADLFRKGEFSARYTDLDRMIVAGVVPAGAAVPLPAFKETGTAHFLERREMGILNLGAPGVVRAGTEEHRLGTLDCLYLGRGVRDVSFAGDPAGATAFYCVSTPAHADRPAAVVRHADIRSDPIGDASAANRRRINRCIHPEGIGSCQLVMGFTEFEPGSVWNTMPPHTHSRRSEVYLYFDLRDQIVVHLLGEPSATRHVIVRDREAVLSPSWSIHCGAGTGPYRFVWAMGGDNQVFSDMDPAPLGALL